MLFGLCDCLDYATVLLIELKNHGHQPVRLHKFLKWYKSINVKVTFTLLNHHLPIEVDMSKPLLVLDNMIWSITARKEIQTLLNCCNLIIPPTNHSKTCHIQINRPPNDRFVCFSSDEEHCSYDCPWSLELKTVLHYLVIAAKLSRNFFFIAVTPICVLGCIPPDNYYYYSFTMSTTGWLTSFNLKSLKLRKSGRLLIKLKLLSETAGQIR